MIISYCCTWTGISGHLHTACPLPTELTSGPLLVFIFCSQTGFLYIELFGSAAPASGVAEKQMCMHSQPYRRVCTPPPPATLFLALGSAKKGNQQPPSPLQACLWFTDKTAAPAWARAKSFQVTWTDTGHLPPSLSGPAEASFGMQSLRSGPASSRASSVLLATSPGCRRPGVQS